MDMNLMKQVTNFASGNDLIGLWDAFITAEPDIKKWCADEMFAKTLTILANTVENIGKLCGGDYKKFLEEIMCDYEYYGHYNYNHGEDWVIYDSSSGIEKYVSFQCANEMIQYILENVHWEDYGTDEDEILKRFIEYMEKERSVL